MACYLITEVDSVLPADPVAPSSTGHRFYLAMSECVLRVAGLLSSLSKPLMRAPRKMACPRRRMPAMMWRARG
jgi:hypothetical protein